MTMVRDALVVTTIVIATLLAMNLTPRRPHGGCEQSKADIASATVKKYVYEAFPSWKTDHPGAACPVSLEALNEYMNNKGNLDPWGTPYELLCRDRRAVVHSRGEDGVDDTDDDIWSRDDLVHLATVEVAW